MNNKRTKVEFIESYWKDGNTDYIWNDNHGELIRCKDCRWRTGLEKDTAWHPCDEMAVNDNWFCADGERRKHEAD